MEERTCPYPGLRPFTEKEAIFFKGRDLHIGQIIKQLGERKFVMLTGASGDGKSSIVYAGVIPNIRAGFLKAKFNNWIIAAFRPERSPMVNLSNALSESFGLGAEKINEDLKFGFSALLDLYRSSDYFLDTGSREWLESGEKEQKLLKRKAANLFVLVDQFEEFFTNPENFRNGVPSVESQAVVNLLLETSRLALLHDLPVYIVCTMRSDYIGQCASFRGLPEFIGFSQFFVPRLKRNEIEEVITGPTVMNGDRISRRLAETLLNSLHEGWDQLPVLQHTLNQIWSIADKGREEIDMIHLARVAGMPPEYLPADQKQDFDQWYNRLPNFRKAAFSSCSLENVLNTKADELYETSHEYYNANFAEAGSIPREQIRLIIKKAFMGLTRFDENRAVRNRMTLQELTDIVSMDGATCEKMNGILSIFREQGNTFLSPFIEEGQENKTLSPATVLDITHESLIRNWALLESWAKEEYDNRQVYLDLEKQLQRWTDSNKSKDYLLPLGPLSYFEEWYERTQPNKYWLAKYDESDLAGKEKLAVAGEKLVLAYEFISKSRGEIRKVESAKRRMRIIFTVVAIFLIATLSGLSIWAFRQQSVAREQTEIAEKQKTEAFLATANEKKASEEARQAKEAAEENAKMALRSKETAEKARQEALAAKQRAEASAKLALVAKENALKAHSESEKQRAIAEQEKERADRELRKSSNNFGIILLTKAGQAIRDKDYNAGRMYAIYSLQYLEKENIQEAGKMIENNPDFPIKSEMNVGSKYACRLTSDNKVIFAYPDKGNLFCYDLSAGKILNSITGCKDIMNLSFPTDASVAASFPDGTVRIWDTGSGEEIRSFTTNYRIKTFAYNPWRDELFLLDDLDQSHFMMKNTMYDLTDNPYKMFFTRNGGRWGAVYNDNTIMLLNPEKIFSGHSDSIITVGFCSTGRLMVSASRDRTVKIWNVQKLNDKPVVLEGHRGQTNCFGFSPDMTYVVSGSDDHTVKVWDVHSGSIMLNLCGHGYPVREVCFSDSLGIVSIDTKGHVVIWDVSNLKPLKENAYTGTLPDTEVALPEVINDAEKKYRYRLDGIDLVIPDL
ncbi:MAG: hypothetical protein KJ607_10245 [Bacteroidetes bacterium]|nr:hypothetical protein [Bacteroidota bacterium]